MSSVWLSRSLLHLVMSEPADATGKSDPHVLPISGALGGGGGAQGLGGWLC